MGVDAQLLRALLLFEACNTRVSPKLGKDLLIYLKRSSRDGNCQRESELVEDGVNASLFLQTMLTVWRVRFWESSDRLRILLIETVMRWALFR